MRLRSGYFAFFSFAAAAFDTVIKIRKATKRQRRIEKVVTERGDGRWYDGPPIVSKDR